MSSLLRSTKFVRYFTGAARTLILNTAKTAEVNTLVNPKALCAFNNVGIRDYATTKKAESLEPLLQRLDSEVRRFGRISKRDIDEVFDELRGKNDITSSQSLLVIRCCGELVPEELPEQRTLLVQKIWSVLTERGVPMDISHYNALLRVYLENEHPFSPAKFLEELEKKGLQPNRVTYQRLMWRYCQEGDVEGATKVLEKMRELNFPVSEPVLNALVMGHAFHGDTDGAKAVLQTMAGAGLEPSNRTYTLIACGYAKKGDLDGVNEIIQAATAKDTILTDKDMLEVIEHLALGGHGDKVEQLFAHLQKGVGYNQDVCNLILRLLNKGHETTAKKIMKTMPKTAKTDDTMFKGAFFVKQLLRLNKPPEVLIKACKELKEENLVPNAIFIATDAALQQGQVELAQELFKELKQEGFEIREHFYWPLLAQKGKEGDEEGLLQIIRNMVGEGLPPTGEALRDYVIPYLIGKDSEENIMLKLQIASVPPIHGARNLMVELLENGKIEKAAKIALLYRPRGQYSLIARSLLTALNKTKDINSFVTILHVTSIKPPMAQVEDDAVADEVQNDDRDVIEVGRIVKTAVNNLSKPDLVEKLLTEIHSKGLRISTNSAEQIEQYLGQNMTTKLSELLLKLTSPDLEPVSVSSAGYGGDSRSTPRTAAYLESILNQLKKKNVPNLNRIQKQLLHAYIKENNLEKVQSYLEELKAANFDLNVLTMAQLFEFYCENDQIDKALQIQKDIAAKDPEFLLNKFKAVQMAYAYVRVNKFEEAVKFLKENSSKDELDSFMYNSKCWQLLNTIAEQKNEEKTIAITNVLIESDFMKPSNVILGPSIKVFLLNDNLEGALKRFEECCKLYRSTPWKGELMKALIMKEDATRLQWLADLSTQIHGEVNILHDLVLAFVECGRLRQARRILETPGMHARQRRLEDACQRYVEENKPEYLEGLLEATKELSNIDRSNIFYHLLVSYCKANDTDKALSLWTLLQEEGEVPSTQFLNYLGQHLKSKKRSIPFVMPDNSTVPATPDVAVDKKTQQTKKTEPKTINTPKKSFTSEIENLVQGGKTTEGMDIAIKAIKDGQTPKPTVMKFLLKTLADEGNVEKIQELEQYLNEKMKRDITYDDKLTRAVFMRGAGAEHVEKLSAAISAATTPEDLEKVVRKFPRSSALATVIDDDAILKQCHTIAEATASKGNLLPANLLWMECLIAGKDKEAASLWSSWLSKAPVLVFRRLLQEAHTKKDPELMQKLINTLVSNKNLTPGSIGNAYSRLIGFYLSENRTRDAVTTFEQALKHGVDAENLNKSCLGKLRSAATTEGIQINEN